jgi:hypothetical protein
MRIDSTGLYNNRGLTPGKPKVQTPSKTAEPARVIKKSELQSQQKVVSSFKPELLAQLSLEESDQIKKLFGQFDLATLSGSKNTNDIDDSPGQFVDIIV